MNDYLDITASELLKELHNFFLINTYNGAEAGFWVNEKALIDKHYWMDGENLQILKFPPLTMPMYLS